jgi:DNA-binding SARP family transcriptional activator
VVEFGILGPLKVRGDDGEPIEVTQGYRPALCVLLIEAGHPLTSAQLASAIWGESPLRDPGSAVRTCVKHLRRLLGPSQRIHTSPGGYVLQLAPGDSLDLRIFLDLAEQGQQALADGDPAAAATSLQDAVSLWRDPPLADLPKTVPMIAPAARLARLRHVAEDSLAEARLALGRHHQLVDHLRAAVAADPAREHSWAQLMLALYRCGRKAEALGAFVAAREALAGELGIEPGAELQAMHRRILRDDPGLSLAQPARTAAEEDTHGHRPAEARRSPSQLPADIADFTGRGAETAVLAGVLDPGGGRPDAVPVAVVSGPPGAGKTTIAVHVSHAVAGRYPGGQLYLDLAGSSQRPREPGQVLGEALRALWVPGSQIPETTQERAALYRTQLAGRRMLVVLDDAANEEQAVPLLPGATGCAAVITSRNRLGGVPGAAPVAVDTLARGEAVAMLTRIIGEQRVAAEAQAAEDLVTACGLLPFAIRIAAVKLAARPAWPIATLARRVADERRRLNELVVGDIGVRAAIALSYDALDPVAQRAFRLASLAGPHDFAEWVITALLGDPAPGAADQLVDKSLLTPLGADATGEPRYRLHDLLRNYAAERLADDPPDQREAALDRLLTGMLELADVAQAALPWMSHFPPPVRLPERAIIPTEQAARLTANPWGWLNAEQANLIFATELACASARHQTAAHLAACLSAFMYVTGRGDEAEHLWRQVIAAAAAAGDRSAAADAEIRLASLIMLQGRLAEADELADQAMPVLAGIGDTHALARVLYWRAFVASEQERYADAERDARRSLEIAERFSDQLTRSLSLRVLGKATAFLGRHEAGERLCQEALAIARDLGTYSDEMMAFFVLCQVWLQAGKAHLVAEACEQELGQERFAYAFTEAWFRDLLAQAHDALGKHAAAIAEYGHAIAIHNENRQRLPAALCLYRLGASHVAAGDYALGRGYLEECLPVLREYRFSWYVRRVTDELAICRAAGHG